MQEDEIEESKEPRKRVAPTYEEQKVKQKVESREVKFFCEPCNEGFTFKKPYEKHLRTAACK